MNRSLTKEEEEIREGDIIGEVKVTIAKDAFKKPIHCCGKLTQRAWKKINYRDINFTHEVWKCQKCGREYLDTNQAGKMEKFWQLQMLLEGKAPRMERSLNYDGKAYFVRFPKDLTANWARQKKEKAVLTMLTPEKYFIEIV